MWQSKLPSHVNAPEDMTARAYMVYRRTYSRWIPDLDPDLNPTEVVTPDNHETFRQTITRAVKHQEWLWSNYTEPDEAELDELERLSFIRCGSLAGRTLWLGNTKLSRERACSQFNCCNVRNEVTYDLVDFFWLLLNGCGCGFTPHTGSYAGFSRYVPLIEAIPSRKKKGDPRGREGNVETYDVETGTLTISVGDSAEAWAKAVGKLLAANRYEVRRLILDFTEIRAAGERLRGYGWVSNGYEPLMRAMLQIADILNEYADKLLPVSAIHDISNILGTVLSTRRSAEIAQLDWDHPARAQFAMFKKDHWRPEVNAPWRSASNNTVIFSRTPTLEDLNQWAQYLMESGGSEPGICNRQEALRRAPWFEGLNPCGEILLPNRGFCNLVEINLAHPEHRDFKKLLHTIWVFARANYRQTLVSLEDGILHPAWNTNNRHLALCGVSLTGIAMRPDLTARQLQVMRRHAREAANSMARELGTRLPKNVTCGKPSGTIGKVLDATEGIHRPLGRYIFNWITFSNYEPVLNTLKAAGYQTKLHPTDPNSTLVCFPVKFPNVPLDKLADGREVDLESAISQLERYRLYMRNWCDQNMSMTVYYRAEELGEIVQWLHKNWNDVVALSFLLRPDSTLTEEQAHQLGYAYLPQEVVTEKQYEEYASKLSPVQLWTTGSALDTEPVEGCVGGACPVR